MSSGAEAGAASADPRSLLRDAAALVFVDDLDALLLDAPDAHHLATVLRVGEREVVVASDGRGHYRTCRVRATASGRGRHGDVALEATGEIEEERASSPSLAVGFGLQKGERADWTVQKLTELGIDVIIPLLTERTVVRLGGEEARRRGDRLRRIAREASAQSRRVRLPEVLDPVALRELAPERLEGVVVAEPGGAPLDVGTTSVFVGPEGGWSEDELARFGARASLGELVLRSETAAVAAAVLLGTRRALSSA